MVLADISFIDVFWSMLWFFFLFIWIMILFQVLMDLFRDHSLSGWAKAGWVVFMVFLPFLAVFVYLIARGQGMAQRQMKQAQQAQADFADYVQQVGATASPADQIAKAKELHDAGAISDEEYAQLKAKALS